MTSIRKRYIGFLLISFILGTFVPENFAQNPNQKIYASSVEGGDEEPTQDTLDFNGIISICNASFSIPMESLIQFNTTAELPNIVDKTGPCFIRCFFEKSGFIDNWQLNAERIRQYFWPATGDSLVFCENEEKNQSNPCLRSYAIAKCLMIRALVDARNVPM